MENTSINIWKNMDFSDKNEKSAYDILMDQSKLLFDATNGILNTEIEAVDTYLEEEPTKLVALYTMYIVANKLGNFRKKILTVIEDDLDARFTVRIISTITNEEFKGVQESDFLVKVASILSNKAARKPIERLYKQSIGFE